jgi:hypothetical protein
METKTIAIKTKVLVTSENIIISLAFLIPLLVSGPQLLTGSLVNCFLILSSQLIEKKNHYLISVLPSIAAILNGLIFGTFTPFLVYFLPFIWLGNFVLIKSIIYLKNNLSVPLSILFGIILKTLILYSSSLIYFKLSIVPEIFLTAMGLFQFATGAIGGFLTFGVNKFSKIKNS